MKKYSDMKKYEDVLAMHMGMAAMSGYVPARAEFDELMRAHRANGVG